MTDMAPLPALSGDGTRRYRDRWRSGFCPVATQAELPLALAFFDDRARCVGVDSFICLSGDVERDMAHIESVLGRHRGCRPELAAPVRLRQSH